MVAVGSALFVNAMSYFTCVVLSQVIRWLGGVVVRALDSRWADRYLLYFTSLYSRNSYLCDLVALQLSGFT